MVDDDGVCVGIVTRTDIFWALVSSLLKIGWCTSIGMRAVGGPVHTCHLQAVPGVCRCHWPLPQLTLKLRPVVPASPELLQTQADQEADEETPLSQHGLAL